MVDGQIRTFDVTDQRVIQVFSLLRREDFLPPELRVFAYSDASLTLKARAPGQQGRVLLRPMHLARMMQGAYMEVTDRVLVVAGETGYAACLLAELSAGVVTLESEAALTGAAAENARRLGLASVEAVTGRLSDGWAGGGPYDVILVQGGVETNLEHLFGQLAPSGRLIAVETLAGDSSRRTGRAVRFQKVAGDMSERALFDATAPILPDFRMPAAFVFWRLGWPATGPIAATGIAAVALMAAGTSLIWGLSHVALGAVLFHAGLFALIVAAWREGLPVPARLRFAQRGVTGTATSFLRRNGSVQGGS